MQNIIFQDKEVVKRDELINTIKKCPFCDSVAKVQNTGYTWQIMCPNVNCCSVASMSARLEDAVTRWNRRVGA